ncbi:hypothetical protein EON64_09125, partial [archaeon]
MNNRRLARFLFDALLYSALPHHLPTLLCALCPPLLLVFADLLGLLWGGVSFLAVYAPLSMMLLQHHIFDHRDRLAVGGTAGVG